MHDSLLIYLVIYVVVFNGRSRHEHTAHKCDKNKRHTFDSKFLYSQRKERNRISNMICNFYEVMIKEGCFSFQHNEDFFAV